MALRTISRSRFSITLNCVFLNRICTLNGFADYGFIRRHDAFVVGSGRSLVGSSTTLNVVSHATNSTSSRGFD